MTVTCSDCSFYFEKDSTCRRRAPAQTELQIHNSELLRSIAGSLSVIAKIEGAEEYKSLIHDAEECLDYWPFVSAADWCGEFSKRDDP